MSGFVGREKSMEYSPGFLISCLCSGTPKGIHPLFGLIIPSWSVYHPWFLSVINPISGNNKEFPLSQGE